MSLIISNDEERYAILSLLGHHFIKREKAKYTLCCSKKQHLSSVSTWAYTTSFV